MKCCQIEPKGMVKIQYFLCQHGVVITVFFFNLQPALHAMLRRAAPPRCAAYFRAFTLNRRNFLPSYPYLEVSIVEILPLIIFSRFVYDKFLLLDILSSDNTLSFLIRKYFLPFKVLPYEYYSLKCSECMHFSLSTFQLSIFYTLKISHQTFQRICINFVLKCPQNERRPLSFSIQKIMRVRRQLLIMNQFNYWGSNFIKWDFLWLYFLTLAFLSVKLSFRRVFFRLSNIFYIFSLFPAKFQSSHLLPCMYGMSTACRIFLRASYLELCVS